VILSLYLALVPAVSAATSQVLSTESPVEHSELSEHTASCRHIAGSKWRC